MVTCAGTCSFRPPTKTQSTAVARASFWAGAYSKLSLAQASYHWHLDKAEEISITVMKLFVVHLRNASRDSTDVGCSSFLLQCRV